MILQAGYVGTMGTHLLGLRDINPGALNSMNVPINYNNTSTQYPNCPAQYSGATAPTAGNPLGTPGNALQCSRPYFSQFPNFAVIDQLDQQPGLQLQLAADHAGVQSWHVCRLPVAIPGRTRSDYETGELPYVAQNPLDEKAEYGNSDFDIRHTLTGYLDYIVPHSAGRRA